MNKNNHKNYYTVAELAELWGISRVAVFKKIQKGQLPAEKAGNSYIIRKDDIAERVDSELTDKGKKEIEKGVAKVLKDYSETLKLLGQE